MCLELGIDELGYWQELEVYNGQASIQKEERIYPQAMGRNLIIYLLRWYRPSANSGTLQLRGGYLAPLCHKAHARYQVSADLKERLRILQDTSYSSGWDESKRRV